MVRGCRHPRQPRQNLPLFALGHLVSLPSAVQAPYDVSNITGNTRAGIDVRYGIRSTITVDHIPRKPHSSASCEACAWVAPGPFVRDFPAKRRRQVACPASYIISITKEGFQYVTLSHGSAPQQECAMARLCRARQNMHAQHSTLRKTAALRMAL